MVSNWEAVKEGLKLMVLLLTRSPAVDRRCDGMSGETVVGETVVGETAVGETVVGETAVNETAVGETAVNETAVGETPQRAQTGENAEDALASAIRFVTALGLNTLHRGIIQHIHDALLALLDCYYLHATPAAFTRLVAELVAACFESTLPIIRRSGALPFILHSVLTVLHQHASPLLPPLVSQIVCWPDFTPLPPIPTTAQSPEWRVYADAFTQSLSHTLSEADRPRHLVHTLNTLTVCLSSPELATHFHPHLLTLLRISLRLLDAAE